MAIDKPLRDITAADILGLIDARRREDRTTEYKGHWSGDPDAMLKPISAFANTDGGDLIFGIVAKDGIPTDALGIESNEVEQAMVRSMQLARSGLQPPLPLRNLNFQHVALGNGRMVLILRVPPSWAQPHQIRSTNVFYGRNSTESYRLDTTELRQRFLMADSIHTRARGFIETRIAQIRRDGALPVPTPSPKLAFHIVPLRAFTGQLLEIGHKVTQLPKFLPLECYNTGITGEDYSYRINLEGWLNYYQRKHATTTSYTQIFRNGSIEAVFALDVHPDRPIRPGGIFSEYEVKLVLALRHYTTLMRELLVEPPFVLSLAFLNAQAYYLLAGYSNNSAQPFDRDVVVLPDLVVNESDFDTDMALLSLFDMAWQAVGTERSPRNMNGQFQAI